MFDATVVSNKQVPKLSPVYAMGDFLVIDFWGGVWYNRSMFEIITMGNTESVQYVVDENGNVRDPSDFGFERDAWMDSAGGVDHDVSEVYLDEESAEQPRSPYSETQLQYYARLIEDKYDQMSTYDASITPEGAARALGLNDPRILDYYYSN